MLVIGQSEVVQLLPMVTCIQLMRETLGALARGDSWQPLRGHLVTPDQGGVLAWMPGFVGPEQALGIKVLTVFSRNQGTAWDSHQGAVLLFEMDHGSLVAVLDATALTAIRTAAVSGLATDLLARSDAGDLAVLGAGTQAFTHVEAMQAVRPIRRGRVWNRTPERLEPFAARVAQRFGLKMEVCRTVREAVDGADLICTTTAAREPVLEAGWIQPGAHLNVVGSSSPRHREVDSATIQRGALFVDSRESALSEPGDILIPIREGAITKDHPMVELGEVVVGKHPGRRSPEEITIFKSQGLAVEDVTAAQYIYREAGRRGIGTDIELGGKTSWEVG